MQHRKFSLLPCVFDRARAAGSGMELPVTKGSFTVSPNAPTRSADSPALQAGTRVEIERKCLPITFRADTDAVLDGPLRATSGVIGAPAGDYPPGKCYSRRPAFSDCMPSGVCFPSRTRFIDIKMNQAQKNASPSRSASPSGTVPLSASDAMSVSATNTTPAM